MGGDVNPLFGGERSAAHRVGRCAAGTEGWERMKQGPRARELGQRSIGDAAETTRGWARRAPTPSGNRPQAQGSDVYSRNAPLGEPQAICGVRWSTLASTAPTNELAAPFAPPL